MGFTISFKALKKQHVYLHLLYMQSMYKGQILGHVLLVLHSQKWIWVLIITGLMY